IEDKLKAPSVSFSLEDTSGALSNINSKIDKINGQIVDHNSIIDNIGGYRGNIRNEFWEIMRWEYDQTISHFISEKNMAEEQLKKIKDQFSDLEEKISYQKRIIAQEQQKTINIDEAISNINA